MRAQLIRIVFQLLVLTAAVPVHAAKDMFYRTKPHVNGSAIDLLTESGETLQARFESDLIVSTGGNAWGYMNFYLADGRTFEFKAVSGSVELDAAGAVFGVSVLLQLPGFRPQDPLGLATVRVHLDSSDCLIYDIVGPIVADGTLHFEVPGDITQITASKRLLSRTLDQSG